MTYGDVFWFEPDVQPLLDGMLPRQSSQTNNICEE